MTTKELIGRLKEISQEVAELSRACGREIVVMSPTESSPHMKHVTIGSPLDGYKEHLDMWTAKEDGSWLFMNNYGFIEPEKFNISEKEENGTK